MPRDRTPAPPFETDTLALSLDRYLAWGLVFMVMLIAGFVVYKVREPDLRSDALTAQTASYREIGTQLFSTNCASCHGKGAVGGSAPVLNSQQFLKSTTDAQIGNLIASGVPGSDMPPWSLAFAGTLTDEQIRQLTTYLRSLEPDAPSVPAWRKGRAATAATATTAAAASSTTAAP
jgi:mono/diheme cytochrome c family protein